MRSGESVTVVILESTRMRRTSTGPKNYGRETPLQIHLSNDHHIEAVETTRKTGIRSEAVIVPTDIGIEAGSQGTVTGVAKSDRHLPRSVSTVLVERMGM